MPPTSSEVTHLPHQLDRGTPINAPGERSWQACWLISTWPRSAWAGAGASWRVAVSMRYRSAAISRPAAFTTRWRRWHCYRLFAGQRRTGAHLDLRYVVKSSGLPGRTSLNLALSHFGASTSHDAFINRLYLIVITHLKVSLNGDFRTAASPWSPQPSRSPARLVSIARTSAPLI